jgi:hypothetical protein
MCAFKHALLDFYSLPTNPNLAIIPPPSVLRAGRDSGILGLYPLLLALSATSFTKIRYRIPTELVLQRVFQTTDEID